MKTNLLGVKRAIIFVIGLILFWIPGQNWYLSLPLNLDSNQTNAVEPKIIPANDYPVHINDIAAPILTAKSIVVIDYDSAVPLYEKNENERLLPASTSKIMTALTALDYYQLNDILTMDVTDTTSQTLKIIPGDKFTVENLIYALLVSSANDVGDVLAKNYPGGTKEFVKAMNLKASELHLDNSIFANPTGLDSDQNGNPLLQRSYSTSLDLARLGTVALKNDLIKKIVSTKSYTIMSVDTNHQYLLNNVNTLLNLRDDIYGIKTGWTEDAGECLVGLAERNDHKIVTVVLGSDDRFGETIKLVDWTFNNFNWQPVKFYFQN